VALMATSFTMSFQAGDAVRVLTVMQTAMDNPTELMRDILLVMIRSTQLNFEAGGRPTRWTSLQPSTILRRLRRTQKGRSAVSKLNKSATSGKAVPRQMDTVLALMASIQILRDTGLLFQSVGAGAGGEFSTADGFGVAEKYAAILATNRPGADAHQLGYPEGNIPERPFFLLQPEEEGDIADMGMQWLMRTGPYALAI
jgi:phage gpG-like protein